MSDERLRVYVPHVEEGPHPDVLAELALQAYAPEYFPMRLGDLYSYSDLIRDWWRRGDGFVVIEADSVPPPRAIRAYELCAGDLCCRPHDCRTPAIFPNFACTKFSARVIERFPSAADEALAGRYGTAWYDMGLCTQKPPYRGASRPSTAATMCLDTEAVSGFGSFPGPLWPATVPYPMMDTALLRYLAGHGVQVHRHGQHSTHHPDRVHRVRFRDAG